MPRPETKPGASTPSRSPASPAATAGTALPLEKRNGASVWVPGSYDPALNLAFFGVAQTYDTGPLRNRRAEPTSTTTALYTDSTLAINPDTGKLVWYFQHQPNDQWDLDWAFERACCSCRSNGAKTLVGHRRQAGDLRRHGSRHGQVRLLDRSRPAERRHRHRSEDAAPRRSTRDWCRATARPSHRLPARGRREVVAARRRTTRRPR